MVTVAVFITRLLFTSVACSHSYVQILLDGMGKRLPAAKMEAVRRRIRDLVRFGHGCYYCKGSCYKAIAPHLSNLNSWLLESVKLKPTALDQELLWIFGKSAKDFRVEEGHCAQAGDSCSSSSSDCESLDSLLSVATQQSVRVAKRSRTFRINRQRDDDRDEFVSDATADSSESNGFNILDDLQETAHIQTSSSSHVHHEAAGQVGYPSFFAIHMSYFR